MRYGRWWAVQRNAGLSLGIHIEFRRRITNDGVRYGPYVDLHIGQHVFSFGVNPIHAGAIDLLQSYSRGGIA
jgi:hypothetical protein